MPVVLTTNYSDVSDMTVSYACTYLPEELAAASTLENMMPLKFPVASCVMAPFACVSDAGFCVNDFAVTNNVTQVTGNVLTNDASGLTVSRVKGLEAFVGVAVNGSNGGRFTINSDGSWIFDPDDDFDLLIANTNNDETYVTYHATDGISESVARLTVAVTGTMFEVFYSGIPVYYNEESVYVL